jgi:hypothetical protein
MAKTEKEKVEEPVEESQVQHFSDEDDVQETAQAAEGTGGTKFLRLPKTGRAPIYMLKDGAYKAGWEHWVDIPGSKTPHKVTCTNTPRSKKEWDTENCELCNLAMESYKEAKVLRNSATTNDQKLSAKSLKEFADRIKPKFACHVLVVMGATLTTKGINPKTHKEQYIYKSDFTKDGDAPMQVGILSLSDAQYLEIKNIGPLTTPTGFAPNERFPWMKAPGDRSNRVLWAVRGTNASGNAKVFFVPEKLPSECPADPKDYEELTVEDDFLVDMDDIHKTYTILTSEEGVEEGADSDVDLASGEEAAEEQTDDLSDVGDEFLDEEPGTGEDGLEGDIPEEEPVEEEEASAPAPRRGDALPLRKAAPVRTPPRKAVPTQRQATRPAPAPQKKLSAGKASPAQQAARRSGKTRL